MLEFEEFDITPVPAGTLSGFRAEKWNAAEAIAEAIDNSFGPDHGNADNVWITWDSSIRLLTILDDGVGMTEPGLLLRLGDGQGRSVRDIARYGSGGTMLCLWLGDQADIHTIRDGQYAMAHADWDRIQSGTVWRARHTQWVPAAAASSIPFELSRLGHGTMIGLKVPQRRSIQPGPIIEMIGDLFAPGLRAGKRIRFRRHTRHQNGAFHEIAGTWSAPADAESKRFYIKTVGRDVAVDVRAWIDTTLTREESKVRIAFGYRVIEETAQPFKGYSGLHVAALVDLGPGAQDYLTRTKNDFNDDDFYAALVDGIHEALLPLLERAAVRSRELLINGITANLETALTGLFDPDAIVPASLFSPEPRYRWEKQDKGADVPAIVPVREPVKRLRPDPEGSEEIKGAHKGGGMPVKVQIVDGAALSGGLFSAQLKVADETNTEHILVELNKDHSHVQLAIEHGSPEAERLLVRTVLEAVIGLIIDDVALSERALPKPMQAAIRDRTVGAKFSKLMSFLLVQDIKVAS